ncbi:cupin domain-containing protein [Thiospirochaeta perfilievii]|uniref:Cupin domain-containing protein n=1 Tax=Thiospirochaeta perfilievii TaxID=252967 RepID=A0A5C1QDB7_9SPIO|nr:cupin domain-containing protein [Thiospirochaeta perfilievii]QEN05328.1 cupin domain-containing protein [Thiospirochaeta perfilievii]
MEKWILDELKKSQGKQGITIQKVPHSFTTNSVQLTFDKGAVLPIHTTPVDVLFYVIKGKGKLTVGSETSECEEGSYMESPKDIPHGWENVGDDILKILVIKLF